MEMSGQLHAPGALPPESLCRRLGGPQSRVWSRGEKKNLFLILEIEPQIFGHPAPSL
jgi:hypothetical protein